MAKKINQSKLDTFMNPERKDMRLYEKQGLWKKSLFKAQKDKSADLEHTQKVLEDESEYDTIQSNWYAQEEVMEQENSKKMKNLQKIFGRKEKVPEVSPIQSGAMDIVDMISPSSADLSHKDYVIVDGMYFAYLYLTGYGYATTVGNGWLNPLVEAGEGVNLIFTMNRQPKEKTLSKISQATMINRSRMRDVGDTRTDYEELDSAISAGMYLKDGMNRYNEDFYYMHTLIEVSASDVDLLEQRMAAVQNLCISQDLFCKRADYKHGECFLSSLPLLGLDADMERKTRRNALTSSVAAAFPFSSFELCDQSGIMLGINQHNRSVCIVDIFDSTKYANANMSIMGMSGAGKTFLLQLMALRFRQQGIQVFIIAPLKGHEFRPACEAIGGKYIKLSPSIIML